MKNGFVLLLNLVYFKNYIRCYWKFYLMGNELYCIIFWVILIINNVEK